MNYGALLLVFDRFVTVTLSALFLASSIALFMSCSGTLSIFFLFLIALSLANACDKPLSVPLLSTSIAKCPLIASKRLLPLMGTSVRLALPFPILCDLDSDMLTPFYRFLLSCNPNNLFLVTCIANLERSEPTHRRPSFSATARVVPEPQKKSATISPGLEEALIILCSSFSGFCVS